MPSRHMLLRLAILTCSASLADAARAACVEGTITACRVNGKRGAAECINGRVGPCDVNAEPPPKPPTGPPVQPVAGLFDVVANPLYPPTDDNGFPFNPVWRWQALAPTVFPIVSLSSTYCGSEAWKAPCTSFHTTDDNWGPTKAIPLSALAAVTGRSDCESGHHNWMTVTYTGRIFWEAHSPPGTDDDYNFRLVPPLLAGGSDALHNVAGVTAESYLIFPDTGEIRKPYGEDEVDPIDGDGHRLPFSEGIPSIGVEFDTDETVVHFTTGWWDGFHRAVDEMEKAEDDFKDCFDLLGSCSQAEGRARLATLTQKHWAVYNLVSNKDVIVTGLLGLDCAHGCFTEIHPVFAMAIRVNDDPADETWEIFVRRAGDEGFCSANEYVLGPLTKPYSMTLRLPSRGTAVQVVQEEWGSTSSSVSIRYPASDPAKGKLVTFDIPSYEDMVHGELHLRWTGTASAVHHPPPPAIPTSSVSKMPLPPRVGAAAAPTPAPRVSQKEGTVAELVDAMTPDQRRVFYSALPPKSPAKHAARPRSALSATPLSAPSLPPALTRRRTRDLQEADDHLVDALHAVYGPTLDQNLPRPLGHPAGPGGTGLKHCVKNPHTGEVVCPDDN